MRSKILLKKSLKIPSISTIQLSNLCGELHHNIQLIEKFYSVKINLSNEQLELIGEYDNCAKQIKNLFDILISMSNKPITLNTVKHLLNNQKSNMLLHEIKLSRKIIKAKTPSQIHYIKGIDKHDITFAVGPAGTGKTYLAVAKAIQSFEKGEVQRLIFVRPAVEAGEKLGFLPGDLVEKILPYLRPIYDALYEMIGFKETQKLIQSDVIEILPLAFMRGRTLNEAFIILDEAQNATILQMKMFLTRIGFGSKTVVTGDMTQVDLPKEASSGLAHAIKLFCDIPEIGTYHFNSKDVVRHPLVSKIIDCYEINLQKKK